MKEIIEMDYVKNDLESSWFIQKPIDFEHKVYHLMAFLKKAEENIYNGYWFPEYEIIEKRYKDIESFIESSQIVYVNKADREIFEYIYDLPKGSGELTEIQKIAEFGYKVLGNIYYELKAHMEYIIANLKVFNKITDRRKSPTYFIECCESGIIEKYRVGRTSIEHLGTFHCNNLGWLNDESNYVQVISNICIDTERCLIPIARKLIEMGDYF